MSPNTIAYLLLTPMTTFIGSAWGWVGALIGFLIPFAVLLYDNHWKKTDPASYDAWNTALGPGDSRSEQKNVKVQIEGRTYSGTVTRDD